MASDLCVTPHETDRRALPSLRLCGSCRDGMERDITALPRLHRDLERVLSTAGGGGQRVSGTSTRPLPINPAVADHRDQIRHDLTWWTIYVAQERGLTLPANEIIAIGAWLGLHIDWLAANAAEECPPVMADLARRARALLAPSGARRIKIGPCRDSVDGEACTGRLWATVRREDDPRPSVIYCDGPCGAEMSPETWRRFGREYLRQQAS